MSKTVKKLMVKSLVQKLEGVSDLLAGSTMGLTSEEAVRFRAALREKNMRALVVKNSMCARAFDELGLGDGAKTLLDGPTTLFFGGETLVDTAKVVLGQAKEYAKKITVRGGLADGEVLAGDDVVALSKLPSREELIGMIVGGLLSPVSSVVGALVAPAQQVASQIEKISEREEAA
jgi:large subunit ribosomal protein L10